MPEMKKLLGRFAKAVRGEPSNAGVEPETGPRQATPPKPADQPNNELERKLMAAAVDADQRPAFNQMLLKSQLYAATPEPPPIGGSRNLQAGEDLPLLTVQAPDERWVAAIFTSEPRIAEVFGPGVSFIQMQGQALLEIVAHTGAFLNPGSSYRVHWDPAGIAGVLGQPFTREIAKPTKLLLATPSSPPNSLIGQLRFVLGSRPDVPNAWLALAHWPENGEYSWYLDIRTTLQRTDVTELLSEVFKGAPFEGRPLDMTVREPGAPDGIGIRIAPGVMH
jgi:hypothetical protein